MPTIDAATENAAPDDPILITAPGTYTFNGNIIKNFHGMVVDADDVIVDQATYDLKWDNKAANADVANGGFETDALEATSITNWDVTGASAAIIKARDTANMLYGSKVLRLDAFSTEQVLVSDAITVTDTDLQHAMHFSWGRSPAFSTDFKIEALDANYAPTVDITRSGSTATINEVGHSFTDGQNVIVSGANESEYNGTHTITVVDADNVSYTVAGSPATPATGTIIAASVIATITKVDNGERGQIDPLYFVPNTSSVKMRITVTPETETTVDLDFATFRRAHMCGVIASRLWIEDNNFPNKPAMGATAIAAYTQNKPENFTIRNGTITQGANNSLGNFGIFGDTANGLVAGGSGTPLVIAISGIDPTPIGLPNHGFLAAQSDTADNPVVITHTTLTLTGTENISDRFNSFAGIKITPSPGASAESITITDCTMTDCPQNGVAVLTSSGGTTNISDNNIDQLILAPNGYAIGLPSSNVTCHNNTITGRGRGIFAGSDAMAADSIAITNNNITLGDSLTRENPAGDQSPARGIRIRNNAPESGGPFAMTNLTITGNTVTMTSGADAESPDTSDALRISFLNTGGIMDDAGIVISGNTLKAVATGASDTARALNFTGCEAGINITGSGNSLESNDIGVQILDSDGPSSCEDVTFTNSTFIDSIDGYDLGGIKSMSVGFSTATCDNVTFQKNIFGGGATNLITWSVGSGKTFYEGDTVTTTIEDGLGAGLPDVTVTLGNGTLTTGGDDLSNGSGEVSPAIVERKWVDSVNTVTEGDLALTGRKTGRVSIQSTINTAVTKTPVLSLPVAS